jgi:hypothetical protein
MVSILAAIPRPVQPPPRGIARTAGPRAARKRRPIARDDITIPTGKYHHSHTHFFVQEL